MRVVGVIAELNPFHDGHAYLLRQAKEQCGASYAVVVMSGDFVQRGEPAILDKYTRTRQALEGGADLVFELPVRFCVSSAGDFAAGGVMALNSLGFVTDLCFGSECDDLPLLDAVADLLWDEPEAFCTSLNRHLRSGLSFAGARALAITDCLYSDSRTPLAGRQVPDREECQRILHQPNNILGLEYCLALKKQRSPIVPHTIRRQGMDYHDTGSCVSNDFPSSSALRKQMIENDVPHLCLDDFCAALGYALLFSENLCEYKDFSKDLADRVHRLLPEYTTPSALVEACGTRAFTGSRIRRSLIQCLLGIRQSGMTMPYLRLLGMKKEHSSQMPLSLVSHSTCKILSRLAGDVSSLSEPARSLLLQDLSASDLYRQTWCRKYQCELPNEYQRPLIVR